MIQSMKSNPMENGETSTNQLLQAQAHVWNHLFGFIDSMSLKCAIQLRIPDIIHNHGRPIPLSQLLHSITTHKSKSKSKSIYPLMRLLVHSNFFVQYDSNDDQDPCYWLTTASRLLLTGAPLSLAPYVLFSLDPINTKPLQHMSAWLAHDSEIETANNPSMTRLFDEGDSRLVARALVRDYKHVLEGIGTLVEVGGGNGTMAKAIVDAIPAVKCIVLDLPHVVAGLESSDEVRFVGGDMFESIPPADAVLLNSIVHEWDDKTCVKILKRCRDAVVASNGGGGKVMIIDMVVDVNKEDDDEVVEDQLYFDMAMMPYFNSKERSEKEWAKLFSDAGFITYNITPAFGVRSLIELYP